jgi:multidrug efflux system membrane fusion protein
MGVTVGVATAQQGALPIVIDALGTVVPAQQVSLTAQVSGVLQEVLFEEGQLVQKGQLLARIDPRTFEQTLQQAKAQTARDQAQLAAAQQTLKRYETLWQQDSIARQDVDTQAALVKQLQATVQSDQASVRAAQISLDYTRITAPMSGRIGLRAVDPGNLINSSTTAIASIAQISPVNVSFAVPQDRVAEVLAAAKAGQLPAKALNRARTQTLATGRFLTLDNSVDTATGTVKAKARFDNADYALFPNQFVNLNLRLGEREGVLVPVSALRLGPNGPYVYVVDEAQKAQMRPVVRGAASNEQVQITQGLQAGERVVTEGGDRVKDGGKVQLASDSPTPGASGAGRGVRGKRRGASGAVPGDAGAGAGGAGGASGASGASGAGGASAGGPGAGGSSQAGLAGAPLAAPGASGARPSSADQTSMQPLPPKDRRQPGDTAQQENRTEGRSEHRAEGGGPSGDGRASGDSLENRLRKLPPEIAEKIANMSEEERKAFFAQRRAAREAQRAAAAAAGEGGGNSGGAAPNAAPR